jgi:hypothetical protein
MRSSWAASEGSDLVSGCMIKPDGVARLDNWGILPDLLATGCLPIAPRRNILDRLLQQQPVR